MENNDIAVQFVKYDMGSGVYVFKPVGIIEGKYDKELEIFKSNFGELYESIKHSYSENLNYFFASHNIDELKEKYEEEDKNQILNLFYQDFLNYIYVGLSNDVDIDVAAINIDSIGGLIEQRENKNNQIEEEKSVYWFSEEGIMELMILKSMKEVRKRLADLIQSDNNEKSIEISNMKVQKEESKKLKLSELKKEVLDTIIGQDEAVNSVTTTMIVNENSKNPRHKSHILIAGPSGTGKTEMMNVISKKMNKSVFKADATAYTKEGYVGKGVYSMLKGLIEVSNGDLEKAQNGILIIDEIDKKVSKESDDVSGTAVINSLLKIMDRDVIEVDTTREETVQFDTSNLTIVFMGAFSDLYEKKSKSKSGIGFCLENSEKEDKKEDVKITKEDLIEYGLPPEFIGRIANITYTKELNEEDLVRILKNSKTSPLRLEKEFFEDMDVKVIYTNGYIEQLAKNCLKYKTGARELKSEVQKSLEKVYEEVLNNPGRIKVLKLNKKTAQNNRKYRTE